MSDADDDREWEACANSWLAASGPPVDGEPLRRLLQTQRRRLLAVAIGEAVLVLAFAALSWLVARDGVVAWEAVWLLTLWAFTLVALAFVWWNRRGTWRSLGRSVEEHLRLARRRAERQRRAGAFAGALFVVETVAIVMQLAWFDRLTPLALVVLAAVGAGVAVGCAVARRRSGRELERLADYQRESAVS
jgi:hypothetical protein